MKVWPIDPLVPRNLRLEVPEKLPQGLAICPWKMGCSYAAWRSQNLLALHLVLGMIVGDICPLQAIQR